MTETWFDDIPTLAQLPPAAAAAKLLEVGEDDAAAQLASGGPAAATAYGPLSILRRPWSSPSHVFGHIDSDIAGKTEVPVRHIAEIAPDESLRDQAVTVSLGSLAIADYPGGGNHVVLFDFFARHQQADQAQDLHYNLVVRAAEGQAAAVVNYPIFTGLRVGPEGASFSCFTVNVKNEDDEAFLRVLDSDVLRAGLKLVEAAQPAIAPLTQLAYSVTQSVAKRHRNVPIQKFNLGLAFDQAPFRACLREGAYVAVQIPPQLERAWDWSQWIYAPRLGEIVNGQDTTQRLPYNNIVFTVSRYE
jgi:hypothetical protein